MGVEGFRGSICNKNRWKRCCHVVNLSKISSLFMDFNGIIHKAKAKIYLLKPIGVSDDNLPKLSPFHLQLAIKPNLDSCPTSDLCCAVVGLGQNRRK